MSVHSQVFVAMLNSQAGQQAGQTAGQNGVDQPEDRSVNHPVNQPINQPINQVNQPNQTNPPNQLKDQTNPPIQSNQPNQMKPQVNQTDSSGQTNGQLSKSELGEVQEKPQNSSLKSQIASQPPNHHLPPVKEASPSINTANGPVTLSTPSSSSSPTKGSAKETSKEPAKEPAEEPTKEPAKESEACPSIGSSMNSSFSTLSTANSKQESKNSNGDQLTNGHADKCELFPDLVFDLKELFRLSVKFTRENENKAFYPSYDDRNLLYALNYQIRLGAFNEEKAPQLGALDFVGKDRRLAWKALGDLSAREAMQQFIGELNRICPSFKPFIEAHNQERVERALREEEERKRIEDERRQREEEEERVRKENAEAERKELQRQEVKEALKKQTFYQFQSYAQQQYPNDPAAQEQLIKSLEELHYQQFLQQVMQFQGQRQLAGGGGSDGGQANAQTDDLTNGLQQFNLNGDRIDQAAASSENGLNDLDRQFGKMSQQEYANNQRALVDQNESEPEDSEEETEDEEELSEAVDSDNDSNYAGKSVQVTPPQMWSKKIIKQFKESISIDSGDGVIKVGYGETLTIRVPTVPEGNCIVWEFATDNYDIGFGLFFEPNDNPGDQVEIMVSESEDEEEETEPVDRSDPEKGSRESKKQSKTSYVLPIIPISRRDCFEEVYCGSHLYPGKGTYLLKFDNSYSLWRAKTLYYRVFFSS